MAGDGERLTLDGTDSADGAEGDLVLLDDAGNRYLLPVDDGLRAAVGHQSQQQSEQDRSAGSTPAKPSAGATMDAPVPLRPRDIQARIRAGATAEEVAEAAGSTVEKVLVYARPVLAERAHMAQRAQRSSVRRSGGEGAGHRTLGDAVAARLRSLDADPEAVEWDSRKREDGRWVLTASYTTADRSGLGRFTFDPPGNFVLLDDDDARWLVGDDPEPTLPESGAPALGVDEDWEDDAVTTAPRLVAVADDELPLGGDALRLVAEPPSEDRSEDRSEGPSADASGVEDSATEEALEQVRASESSDGAAPGGDTAREEPATDPAAASESSEEEPDDSRRRRGRKRGRASVPSWDEIMFGGRKD